MKKVLLGTDILLFANSSKEELGTIEYLLEWMTRINEKPFVDISTKIILSNYLSDIPPLIARIPILTLAVRKNDQLRTIEKLLDAPTPLDIRSDSMPAWKKSLAHLALLLENKVDYYITDSPLIISIARKLDLDHRVFSVESYLDRCSTEFRDKDPNKGLVIKYGKFRNLNLQDEFFDSFKKDYKEYLDWFHRKQDDYVYYSQNSKGKIHALLKLKIEDNPDQFDDIIPIMSENRCLKISSFKINVTGSKLSERFMRIIFKTAIQEKVDSIYVTIFNNEKKKQRLIDLLQTWGFFEYGHKTGSNEIVLKRHFEKKINSVSCLSSDIFDKVFVKNYYPFHSPQLGVYLVPLRQSYLGLLLGDESILEIKSDINPYRNSISKVIAIKNSQERIIPGVILLFYRMTHVKDDRGLVGVGIVEGVRSHLRNELQFVGICRKRSGFSIKHLKDCWKSIEDKNNLTLIEFLFVTHLNAKEFNESHLNDCGIKTENLHSQMIYPIDLNNFKTLIKDSDYERDYIAY